MDHGNFSMHNQTIHTLHLTKRSIDRLGPSKVIYRLWVDSIVGWNFYSGQLAEVEFCNGKHLSYVLSSRGIGWPSPSQLSSDSYKYGVLFSGGLIAVGCFILPFSNFLRHGIFEGDPLRDAISGDLLSWHPFGLFWKKGTSDVLKAYSPAWILLLTRWNSPLLHGWPFFCTFVASPLISFWLNEHGLFFARCCVLSCFSSSSVFFVCPWPVSRALVLALVGSFCVFFEGLFFPPWVV